MPRKKKATGKEINHGNCITNKISKQRANDLKTLKDAKEQQVGKEFEMIPIYHGYKLRVKKPPNNEESCSNCNVIPKLRKINTTTGEFGGYWFGCKCKHEIRLIENDAKEAYYSK